jgi:hypothetical protein
MGARAGVNPYVFFVGCPRSGTTLLARIGDAHPELAIIRELHWVPQLFERRTGLTADGFVTPELVATLLAHPRLPRLEIEPSAIEALVADGRPKTYARFVTELFDLHGQAKEKWRVGEKTPAYVRSLSLLHSLWPEARFVHLIRDGRDVALSLMDWCGTRRAAGRFPTWLEDPVSTSALFWDWNVRLGREAAGRLGPERYYELRYESLVAEPESACESLCEFLGLAFDPAMLRFHGGRTRSKKSGPRRPVTTGLRRWREQLRPSDVARFEAAAGRLLDELGYERAVSQSAAGDLRHADRLCEAFTDHVHARGRSVPAAWERLAA